MNRSDFLLAIASLGVIAIACYVTIAPLLGEEKRVQSRANFLALALLPKTMELMKEVEFAVRFAEEHNNGLDWLDTPELVQEALSLSDVYSVADFSDGWALPAPLPAHFVFLESYLKRYRDDVIDDVPNLPTFDEEQRARFLQIVQSMHKSMSYHLTAIMAGLTKITNDIMPEEHSMRSDLASVGFPMAEEL